MKPYWLQDYERDRKENKPWQKVVSSVLKRLSLKKTTTEEIKDGKMKPDDPLERARLLKEKIKSTLADLDVEVDKVSITLDDDHNDIVSIQILILPDAVRTPDEIEVESKFNDIVKGFKNE